ncbi:hypothetical protein ABK040_002978 [Willaertia magna]
MNMDGFSLLERDHQMVRDLISRFRNAVSWDIRCDILVDMINNLNMHTSAEERYVYDLAKTRLTDGNFIFEKNLLDNQIHKEMMEFIWNHIQLIRNGNFIYNDVFFQVVEKFFTVLDEHIREEENLLFPRLRDTMNVDELSKLYRDIEWGKQNAPTLPHPKAPTSGIAAKIMHPVSGLVDSMSGSKQ